jgi:hypothetical protein
MNEEMESFEQRLKRQPLRPIPADWRKEILSAAAEAQPLHRTRATAKRSFIVVLRERVTSLFWPHPVAWAALGAVWMLIFGIHFSIRDQAATPVMAEKTPVASPVVVAELKQQKQMLAELMGTGDAREVDRQKIFTPRPRSERTDIVTV